MPRLLSSGRPRVAFTFAPLLAGIVTLVACTSEADHDDTDVGEGAFSSNQATLLDFDFDGELVTASSWNDNQTIQDQLLYTIGHLNADKSVGRLDNLVLSNVRRSTEAGGKIKITYHAKLPVAWGRKTNLPSTYSFTLPRDVSTSGVTAFTDAHKTSCVDWGAHDVDSGSMWYYFRPRNSGCSFAPGEVITTTATATRSTQNTTGKYPEYHKVWEDNALEVVAIFGKFEDGATSPSDAGISAYNSFVASMARELAGFSVVTTPATIPASPGVSAPDIQFDATLADGKKVKVTALLVDNIASTPRSFDVRYEALSPTADVIAYNGHAGLGQNVRALARKGRFVSGKYQIIFMNGCDTFAYVDGSLAQTRAALNPDDPTGTKYMEFVTNAMPSFFQSMSNASTTLFKGLLSYSAPKTYDKIFEGIDTREVVLVTGEEDNVFTPGMPIGSNGTGGVDGGAGDGGSGATGTFTPFEESGTLAKNESKSYVYDVPAGTYKVDLSGTGDADLYVRKDQAATKSLYDCRPYKAGSVESCSVTFATAGKLHVMVNGYAAQSTYTVKGSKP
ncbi:Alkaline serine protease [Labilithrix luteola]|uniref:Alkaline serine protease n=1 Tax=Labilithrix luteola TaxID=1391654 RepID=A0A0K1PJ57_9BACT|nr:PPC domain-containing protein [Labilithrix luteola]AKU93555.1 Alkaline serine protease [Labilithrix luteola]